MTTQRIAEERVNGRRRYPVIRYAAICCVAVAAGVLVFAGREPALQAIGDFLVIQDVLPQARRPSADGPQPVVIHVIAGSDNRTDYAIQIYKQRYALGERPTIFFTGGWCTFHGYYHGSHGNERAEAQGVPPEDIAIDESRVISTYDEVTRLKEFIANSPTPAQTVIVVSDPFHMRRANWTYRMLLGRDIRLMMAPVPFDGGERQGQAGQGQAGQGTLLREDAQPLQRRWWTDSGSRAYVKEEYLKMVYYFFRYRLNLGPVRQWLASLDRE